jgi:hypothetical protein
MVHDGSLVEDAKDNEAKRKVHQLLNWSSL